MDWSLCIWGIFRDPNHEAGIPQWRCCSWTAAGMRRDKTLVFHTQFRMMKQLLYLRWWTSVSIHLTSGLCRVLAMSPWRCRWHCRFSRPQSNPILCSDEHELVELKNRMSWDISNIMYWTYHHVLCPNTGHDYREMKPIKMTKSRTNFYCLFHSCHAEAMLLKKYEMFTATYSGMQDWPLASRKKAIKSMCLSCNITITILPKHFTHASLQT